nr:HEAT repeat domain-containing protein [Planctomycetota bacterium]
AVLDSIRHQVRNLVEEPDAIADELLLALLRSRRLLVIFDHLSEMLEQSRKGVEQALADFPLNAVAVTSRIHETLNGIPRTHWEPVRIEAGFLAQFVDAYLTHKQVRRDFPDPEFFRCCEKLSSIVQGRNVTPLLARLYVNLIVSSKLRAADTHLPENVPDLMLSYVNELNRNFEQGSVPNSAIHADLKLIAWECLRDSFRPGTAKLSDVIRVLGNEDAMNRLKFLDSRLKIIDFVQPAGDRVTIRLDPLAEYMAAFHIVATWKGNQKRWDSFMKKADASTGTQAIAGFLLAVRDCSMLPHSGVPAEIPEALAERAGIDSRLIASQQIQQRLQRSLAALDAPETMDRRAALEALSDMGCDAAPAVVQIIKRLDDEDALIREKAAYALGEIGADAAKGASRLADLLTDPESRVRLTAVAALGQIGPAAGATTLAICRSLVKENESPYEDVALCSMVAFGIGAISALIEVCQKQKPKVVLTAIRALGDIGPLAAAAEEVLCKRTRSRNETIREAAVRSLGKLFALPNSETKEGGPTETRAVKPSKKTIETLIRCLGDSYSETSSPGWAGNQTHYPVRNAAQGSLQLIGSTAAPILIPFLDDPARTEEIEDALSRLGSPVVPVIIGQLTDGDEQRCESALRILARIGHDTDGVAEAIWEFIECCTQSLVSPAIRSLQQIGGLESSVSRLIQILDDSKDDLRDVVVEAIGRSGPDAVAAAPKLVALLAEVGLSNNYEVKQALTRMGKPALPVLMAACKDKRSAVRQAVAEVIGSLGQDAREAVPTLASLVMDEEKDVEMAALDALQNITRR